MVIQKTPLGLAEGMGLEEAAPALTLEQPQKRPRAMHLQTDHSTARGPEDDVRMLEAEVLAEALQGHHKAQEAKCLKIGAFPAENSHNVKEDEQNSAVTMIQKKQRGVSERARFEERKVGHVKFTRTGWDQSRD